MQVGSEVLLALPEALLEVYGGQLLSTGPFTPPYRPRLRVARRESVSHERSATQPLAGTA